MSRSVLLIPILIAIGGLVMAQDDSVMFGVDQEEQQQQMVVCNDAYQWTCSNGECIARYDVCDGIVQCEDGSDEANCKERPQLQPAQEPARKVELRPKPNVTTTAAPTANPKSPNQKTLRITIIALFLVMALAVFIRFVLKRRAARAARNFRKGESLIEDEDDLLISQIYS